MGWFNKSSDDWVILHAKRGKWKVKWNGGEKKYDENCNFVIKFSPSRHKVKIDLLGYKPDAHPLYDPMMHILSIYSIGILENKLFSDIKKEAIEYFDSIPDDE